MILRTADFARKRMRESVSANGCLSWIIEGIHARLTLNSRTILETNFEIPQELRLWFVIRLRIEWHTETVILSSGWVIEEKMSDGSFTFESHSKTYQSSWSHVIKWSDRISRLGSADHIAVVSDPLVAKVTSICDW
jgi:hypothetical protein